MHGGHHVAQKFKHDHLPAILAERDGVVGVLHGKVGSVRTNAGGMRAAIASDESSEQSNEY